MLETNLDNDDLFEGDIVREIANKNNMWPRGIVPYEIKSLNGKKSIAELHLMFKMIVLFILVLMFYITIMSLKYSKFKIKNSNPKRY